MQGSPEIIDFLNEALAAEVTAINQYFVNSKVCENWGWDRLAAKMCEESRRSTSTGSRPSRP